jgi:F0F1-type ATP synthase assembly protein I
LPELLHHLLMPLLAERFMMSDDQGKNKKADSTLIGAGVAIGMGVGLAIGNAMGNIGAGLAIGIAIGFGAGVAISKKKKS